MMALARTRAETGFNRALDGWESARGRPSRRTTAMIVVSVLALHAVGGLYLYNQRFQLRVLPTTDEPPVVVVKRVVLVPPPPRPKTTLQPKVIRVHDPLPTSMVPKFTIPITPIKAFDASSIPGPTTLADQPPPREVATLGRITATGPKTIRNPNWIRMPTPEQMSVAYPARALDAGRGGLATLSCTVDAAGAIKLCSVVKETPAGSGFGAAAMKLSRYFRMSPRTEDGTPVDGGVVLVPVKFAVAG